ncbi:hypothetical protein ABBQ32_005769 [Trebouxia sp. C0010 RCD-2024]
MKVSLGRADMVASVTAAITVRNVGTAFCSCNWRRFRRSRKLLCNARQGSSEGSTPLRTRLTVKLTSVPYRLDMYFTNNPWRKVMWSATAFSSGYYSANTVSLSFGALAINDVIAAATTVAFCEVVSKAYWSASSPGLALAFLNFFKLGVIAALIADAFKLS